jgi:hypothetical protein
VTSDAISAEFSGATGGISARRDFPESQKAFLRSLLPLLLFLVRLVG